MADAKTVQVLHARGDGVAYVMCQCLVFNEVSVSKLYYKVTPFRRICRLLLHVVYGALQKHDLMNHVSHQTIVMQFILELAKSLELDPRSCIRAFFNR